MAIVDFKSMKHDKEQFDASADQLIKSTVDKKKEYATLYNKANMLKNEITVILNDIFDLLNRLHIKSERLLSSYSYTELTNYLESLELDKKSSEEVKIYLYKIQIRLDEINKLRTSMIKLDVYDTIKAGLEDNTLSESYIDMDKIREERGISLIDEIDDILTKFSIDTSKLEPIQDYYEYTIDGLSTLRMIANELYGSPSYWVYIYNYEDNRDTINKIAVDNYVTLEEIADNYDLLSGVKLKLPKEIDFYSEEFNTTTLKKIS